MVNCGENYKKRTAERWFVKSIMYPRSKPPLQSSNLNITPKPICHITSAKNFHFHVINFLLIINAATKFLSCVDDTEPTKPFLDV